VEHRFFLFATLFFETSGRVCLHAQMSKVLCQMAKEKTLERKIIWIHSHFVNSPWTQSLRSPRRSFGARRPSSPFWGRGSPTPLSDDLLPSLPPSLPLSLSFSSLSGSPIGRACFLLHWKSRLLYIYSARAPSTEISTKQLMEPFRSHNFHSIAYLFLAIINLTIIYRYSGFILIKEIKKKLLKKRVFETDTLFKEQ